jgi:hypothetical protein
VLTTFLTRRTEHVLIRSVEKIMVLMLFHRKHGRGNIRLTKGLLLSPSFIINGMDHRQNML